MQFCVILQETIMATKVIFISRVLAENLVPPENSVIISFYDVSEPPAALSDQWLDICRIRCHDTDGQQMGLEVYSNEMAKQVADFAVKHFPNVDHFYVHCQLGQSRSGATALAISEYFGVPCFKATSPVTTFSYKIYNKLVYRRTIFALNGEEDYA